MRRSYARDRTMDGRRDKSNWSKVVVKGGSQLNRDQERVGPTRVRVREIEGGRGGEGMQDAKNKSKTKRNVCR